jgi:hypothetical protein
VFPIGSDKNVTRYQPVPLLVTQNQPTLTLTVSGKMVTVGGAMPSPFTPQNLAVIIAGVPFIYSLQTNDTLTSIATALAVLINAQYPGTTNSGAVITLPGSFEPTVNVGATAQMATEWERQQQRLQITIWAPDPTSRTNISKAIKVAFSQITFLAMPDGFGARVKYVGTAMTDTSERANLYRRDLIYEVEYATTVSQTATNVVAWIA